MTEEAPPVRVWLFPILTALTLVLSFFYYCYSSFGPYATLLARSNKHLENALIETTGDTSALSIVVLGSSLTEYALVDPRGLEDSIFQKTNKKAKVLRIALNYMDINVAKRIDFFNYISKYPPDYLFIENFSFNLDRADTSTTIPEPVNVALLHVRNFIRTAIGVGTHDNYYVKWYTFDVRPQPEDDFYTHRFDSMTYKFLLQAKKSFVRKVSQNSIANQAYDALTKNDVKVVFLDMPLCRQFPHNFLDQQATAELNKTLGVYKTQYRVDYWRFPYVMDDSCFVDGAHLNSKGAMQYQKWFASEIASRR